MLEEESKFRQEIILDTEDNLKHEKMKERKEIEAAVLLKNFLERNILPEEETEEVIKKVKDLRNGKDILIHMSGTEHLENILREGIVSHKFAERAGKRVQGFTAAGHRPPAQERFGMDKISFWDGDDFRERQLARIESEFNKTYMEEMVEMACELLKMDKDSRNKAIAEYFKNKNVMEEITSRMAKAIDVPLEEYFEKKGQYGGNEKEMMEKIGDKYPAFIPFFSKFLTEYRASWKRVEKLFSSITDWQKLVEENLPQDQNFSEIETKNALKTLHNIKKKVLEEKKRNDLKKESFLFAIFEMIGNVPWVDAIVIDKTKLPPSKREEKLGEWQWESLVKLRIAPRLFAGLIFDDGSKIQTEIAKCLIEFLNKYKVPVYNKNGEIIWPKKMTFAESQEWLEQKKKRNNENNQYGII